MKTEVIRSSEDAITEAAVDESSAKYVPSGSVLIVTRSGILKHSLPVATTAVEVTINQDLKAITPWDGLNPDYIAYALRHVAPQILQQCSKSGTTVTSIVTDRLASFRLPMAPLGEQGRIVSALDAYSSRLDAGLAALEGVVAGLDRYQASVLTAACEGRLVPSEADLARREDRDYEPADVLLERLLAERRARWEAEELERLKAKGKAPTDDRWKRKYKNPAGPDSDKPVDLPSGWVLATIAQLADVQGGITKGQRRKNGVRYRTVPYLRVANVQRGYLDLSDVHEIEATEAKVDQLALQPGDVLFNEGGDRDKLGRGWVWEGQIPECIHQNHVFRVRLLTDDVEPKYLSWYGNSAGQAYFMEEGVQTTNLASLNMTKLRQLPVALPPAAEQRRIVQEVERQLSLLDEIASECGALLAKSVRLRQGILNRAFTGRLVPQEADDEAVEVLLARQAVGT